MIRLSRRALALGGLALIAGAARASAADLTASAAKAHVEATIEEILALVAADPPPADVAGALRRLIERRAAVPQLARFAAGRSWRDMSEAQRPRYVDAFAGHVARSYAGRFRSAEADAKVEDLRDFVHVGDARDIGEKGVLVLSEIRPPRAQPIPVEWLVSDRSGEVAISDIVVAGISLAINEREQVSAILEKHGGDVEALIASLEKGVPE